jgi:hypothetical protein
MPCEGKYVFKRHIRIQITLELIEDNSSFNIISPIKLITYPIMTRREIDEY